MSEFKSSLWIYIILSVYFINHLTQAGSTWNFQQNRTHGIFRKARQAGSLTPVDCKMKSWTSWTPCNSCTEKTMRFQYLERPSQYGGSQCVNSQWDEKLCPQAGDCELPDECGEMYTCPESGRCISQNLRCNGESDCGSGSDEDECQEIRSRETKCDGMLRIPGAEKATQGFNALAEEFVSPVLDHRYFGGLCEYIYNGEWRQLTYDAFCENLHYNDAEKYFRKPYNFLSYRLLAHSRTEGSSEYYSDAASLLEARKTDFSFKVGRSFGVYGVEIGLSRGVESSFLTNISQYNSKDVGFVRLTSRVETAQFKMRTRDLVLDEDMLQALMELPEHYDFGSYSRFLREYGTHYVTQGSLGGVLEYVAVVNKETMRSSRLERTVIGFCLGISLGISKSFTDEIGAKITAKHETCKKTNTSTQDSKGQGSVVEDVMGLVKGGTTGSSAAHLVIHDANSYRTWGRTLKYSPAVIDYETLPIYELVRFSTVGGQVGNRLPLLKQAWEEYLQQFNPCRCAPCRNNGVPVLSGTSCSCLCREGYSGLACERTQRQGPTHGGWSCWGTWTPCQSGTRTRVRQCTNPPPTEHGFPCPGTSTQRRTC